MALAAGVLHKISDCDGIGASDKTGREGPGLVQGTCASCNC